MNGEQGDQLLQGFIGSRHGREEFIFDIDTDWPSRGDRFPSPMGVALCVFSEPLAQWRGADIDGLVAPASGYLQSVVEWIDSGPAGWWVLSHRIDNDALTLRVLGPSEGSLPSYLEQLRGYETVETESRRLTFLSQDRIADFVYDSECFAVFLHAAPDVIDALGEGVAP